MMQPPEISAALIQRRPNSAVELERLVKLASSSRSQRDTHVTSADTTRTCWLLSAGVRQCPCKTGFVVTELVTQLVPPSTLASCLGMDRKGECDDGSRTTWLAAAAIASWACGGMAWSCSQMM